MSKSKSYRAVSVKDVDVQKAVAGHLGEPAVVGLDIGKEFIWATLRFQDNSYRRPWKVANPWHVRVFVDRLVQMSGLVKLTVALESSGTYGDPLRQAMSDAGLIVHRVSSKATHDWAEAFDGVPSQNDGKDPGVVAELCAMGKGVPWEFQPVSELEQEISYWVDRMDAAVRVQQIWIGRLESRLARHWPEAGRVLKLSSPTLLKAIRHWGSPVALGADPQAAAILRRFSGWFMEAQKIERLVQGARQSVGVRMTAWDERRLREDAEQALAAHRHKKTAVHRLHELTAQHERLAALGRVVGVPTACVLWSCVGDPRRYTSGAAYRKAMGLNLAEYSSGNYQGKLHITKRGKAMPRRYLYYAALRYVSKEPVRSWYVRKKIRDGNEGLRGLVAVMRKLPLAVYAAAQGQVFDPGRLFTSIVQEAEQPDRR